MSASNPKTLLILVAMAVEEQALINHIKYQEVVYGNRFQLKTKQFSANNQKIIIANSGVGLVNAGLAVTFVCEHEMVDAILVLGVGGALCQKLQMGDAVIANQIIQHDSIASTENGPKLIAAGALTISAPDEGKQVDPVMRCCPELITWLEKAFAKEIPAGTVHVGTILSGSEFVANAGRKRELHERHQKALLVDMEAGAVAQVARNMNIPFGVIKTVADRVDDELSVSEDYKIVLKQASAKSGAVFRALFSP